MICPSFVKKTWIRMQMVHFWPHFSVTNPSPFLLPPIKISLAGYFSLWVPQQQGEIFVMVGSKGMGKQCYTIKKVDKLEVLSIGCELWAIWFGHGPWLLHFLVHKTVCINVSLASYQAMSTGADLCCSSFSFRKVSNWWYCIWNNEYPTLLGPCVCDLFYLCLSALGVLCWHRIGMKRLARH